MQVTWWCIVCIDTTNRAAVCFVSGKAHSVISAVTPFQVLYLEWKPTGRREWVGVPGLTCTHTRWLAATTIATTTTTPQRGRLLDFLGDPLVCTLNVCGLRNVAWATGGHGEGNPLSADVVVQPLSQLKGRLGTNEKNTQKHTLKAGLNMCVSMEILFGWSVCSTGHEWLQSRERERKNKGVPWLWVRTGRLTLSSRNS